MDVDGGAGDNPAMPAKAKKTLKKHFLGLWIRRLGKKQVDVAEAVGITASHLNNIISGKIKKPDPGVLVDITDFLGISVNDIYKRPPPKLAAEAGRQLKGSEVAALGRLAEELARAQGK